MHIIEIEGLCMPRSWKCPLYCFNTGYAGIVFSGKETDLQLGISIPVTVQVTLFICSWTEDLQG